MKLEYNIICFPGHKCPYRTVYFVCNTGQLRKELYNINKNDILSCKTSIFQNNCPFQNNKYVLETHS